MSASTVHNYYLDIVIKFSKNPIRIQVSLELYAGYYLTYLQDPRHAVIREHQEFSAGQLYT